MPAHRRAKLTDSRLFMRSLPSRVLYHARSFYDWHDGNWIQSKTATVKPGDSITGTVTWDAATETYSQSIALSGRAPITTKVTKAQEHGETFTDVYFVVEHQPNTCSEYPSNGNIVFTNIEIAWESGAAPVWDVKQFQPACNSQGKVLNASALEFTWATK